MTPRILRATRTGSVLGALILVLALTGGGLAEQSGPAKPQTPAPSNQPQASQANQGRGGPGGPGGQFPGRGGPGGPGGYYVWWKDDAVKKAIGLRDDQARRIDGLYEKRARDMAGFLDEYNKQRDALDQMIRDRIVGEATVALQISKMEAPYQQLDVSRILMLYRMYQTLEPDQYKKLQAYFDEQRAQRGRGRGGVPPVRPR